MGSLDVDVDVDVMTLNLDAKREKNHFAFPHKTKHFNPLNRKDLNRGEVLLLFLTNNIFNVLNKF